MRVPTRSDEQTSADSQHRKDSQHREEEHSAKLDVLLADAQAGSQAAADRLLEVVYEELRAAAHRVMGSCDGHTLPPTALVHEVMVRFLERPKLANLHDCRCLFSVAIRALETMLIDHRRRKTSLKRGGDWHRVPLDAVLDQIEAETGADYEEIHESLERLAQRNRRQWEVVRLRFFGGMTIEETARTLGVCRQTVEHDWRLARAKLYRDLRDSPA